MLLSAVEALALFDTTKRNERALDLALLIVASAAVDSTNCRVSSYQSFSPEAKEYVVKELIRLGYSVKPVVDVNGWQQIDISWGPQ